MTPAADLRAEAERLARQLPGLNFKAEASEAAHIGSAGRRRAGTGETFWQYRRHAQEDDAGRIDWRRSAKGNDLYVRETELETARTVMFWADDHPGFRWKGEGDLRTKAEEAILLMLTMAIPMSREGERIGSLGSGRRPSFGKRALDRLTTDLLRGTNGLFPPPPRAAATLIVASDFYDPIPEWSARLAPLAAKCPEGVLLAVSAPVEVDFPYEGRVKLSRPGAAIDRILGRAETVREEYQQRFAAQREGLETLARRMGWGFASHVTGSPAIQSAARLKAELERFGAMR
ncbi:MAG: DUF58 domain-containing protein [Hyphomonas sp.]|uniref:DUF58 domain-containing protein n=1 Tax=Hyphomonas sp. TaxID=87 RepID=UPI0018340A7A|nr:DUF58 domain-containing protein [Hyphomonas sp.]MBA3068484.1 DUF58 domain-containing protein [Hyphomonas sp.]MBU3919281.1 DUF58 domain-containing protein [Alphaproteobacteria bacterium]MBU4060649.1 DUF58 domain-containing protein [Alphaproteobacteria bacterium]MBU4164633.1 DUF58 domain-containing protein [Alphaproteobacteria bacterium]